MKMITTLLFCFQFFIQSYSQIEFLFTNLRYKDSAVVYRGIDNRIEILNFNLDTNIHVVKAKIGTLARRNNKPIYFYRYGNLNLNKDTIIIFENGIEIARKDMDVRNIRDPQIFLAGKQSECKISRQLLLAAPYLVVRTPGFLYTVYDVIHNMDIEIMQEGQVSEYRVSGFHLPNELIEIIKNTKSPIILDCRVNYYGLGCGRTQTFHCEIF